MDESRSGTGGKIVANRRKQRLSATPYDRPPPSPLQQPAPARRSSWFSGLIVPSARAIASGAGKIISSVLYTESSSSSEDEIEDYTAEDGGHSQEYEVLNDEDIAINKIETKRLIEKLIMQETFSREECDSLTEVLHSRVTDCSTEKERSSASSPRRIINSADDGDAYNKAILEAKNWFQEKKMGSSSSGKAGDTVGSPVDVAKSYMRGRPPWASPTKPIDLSTQWTMSELSKEGTNSAGHDSLSSPKKRSSIASGSWIIQEEIRKVRAKATEDMLRTPSSKIDPSLFASASKEKTDAIRSDVEKRLSEPDSSRQTLLGDLMDTTGVCSDLALAASKSQQDGEEGETLISKPVAFTSIDNEESESHDINGESSKTGAFNSDSFSKINESPANEIIDNGERQSVNGISTSHASLNTVLTGKNQEQHIKGSQDSNVNKSSTPTDFSTEACVEVPILTEMDSITNGSQNSLSKQPEEFSEEMTQPSTKGKTDITPGQRRGRKTGEYARRGKKRGK